MRQAFTSTLLPPPDRLNSVGRHKRELAEMCVQAVLAVGDLERKDVNLDLIKVSSASSGRGGACTACMRVVCARSMAGRARGCMVRGCGEACAGELVGVGARAHLPARLCPHALLPHKLCVCTRCRARSLTARWAGAWKTPCW